MRYAGVHVYGQDKAASLRCCTAVVHSALKPCTDTQSLHMLMHLLWQLGSRPTSQPDVQHGVHAVLAFCVVWCLRAVQDRQSYGRLRHSTSGHGNCGNEVQVSQWQSAQVLLRCIWHAQYACKRPLNRPRLRPIAQVGGYGFCTSWWVWL